MTQIPSGFSDPSRRGSNPPPSGEKPAPPPNPPDGIRSRICPDIVWPLPRATRDPDADTDQDLEPRKQSEPPDVANGRKADAGKARWDLLPWEELSQVVDVLTYGAQKYAPENWKHVAGPENRYFAAAMRHLIAHRRGDLLDDESGLPHLAHATCCILFLMHFQQETSP